MAEAYYDCDVIQGFNLAPDSQGRVGHLDLLTVGGEALEADFSVGDPEGIADGTKKDVVGVIQSLNWDGQPADTISISCFVSTENKNTVTYLVDQTLSDTTVTLQFTVYEYNQEEKTHFKCFHVDGEVNALIFKEGTELQLKAYNDQNMDVPNPANYPLEITVMPSAEQQDIHKANSPQGNYVKPWGIASSTG